MIVLDASAAIELLLNTSIGKEVARRIASPERGLASPHSIDLEVTQGLRRYVLAGSLPEGDGRRAVEHLRELDLIRYPHEPLLPRIWSLRDNLSAYDAAYVALAEVLGAVLLTCDRALAMVPVSAVRVDVLGD